MEHDLQQTVKKCQDWSAFGIIGKYSLRRLKRYTYVPPEGQMDKWKVIKPRVKAANVPNWAKRSQESIWESGREVGDGTGRRVMECEMCTENGKDGIGWERQWAEIANPAKCRDSLQGAHPGVPNW
jgi:hypothetical protein